MTRPSTMTCAGLLHVTVPPTVGCPPRAGTVPCVEGDAEGERGRRLGQTAWTSPRRASAEPSQYCSKVASSARTEPYGPKLMFEMVKEPVLKPFLGGWSPYGPSPGARPTPHPVSQNVVAGKRISAPSPGGQPPMTPRQKPCRSCVKRASRASNMRQDIARNAHSAHNAHHPNPQVRHPSSPAPESPRTPHDASSEETSERGGSDIFAGQTPFTTLPKGPTDARSVKRASRPRHGLPSVQRGPASGRRSLRLAGTDPHLRNYRPQKAVE